MVSVRVKARRQSFFQWRRLGGLQKRPTILYDVAYRRGQRDDQHDDEPGVHLPHPGAALGIVGGV